MKAISLKHMPKIEELKQKIHLISLKSDRQEVSTSSL
jgi:hypothetical protein